MNPPPVAAVSFEDYETSVPAALDAAGAGPLLKRQRRVLIKPNLVNASPPPVTTPVACCEAVVRYARARGVAEIVIAEGCGDPATDTHAVFAALGYPALSRRWDAPLLDLNTAPLRRREAPGFTVFPEIHLPEIAFSHFIVSVPVLKAHSLADLTGALKNQMGFAPPAHYSGPSWNKAAFHQNLHTAIIELNRHRAADLALMDGSVGLSEFHLGGPTCDPPAGRLLAGTDPRAVDRAAARLLRRDPDQIPHLCAEIAPGGMGGPARPLPGG
jgi:uncharacterized protein (DUF362 family)